jgi:hypothetical protein
MKGRFFFTNVPFVPQVQKELLEWKTTSELGSICSGYPRNHFKMSTKI